MIYLTDTKTCSNEDGNPVVVRMGLVSQLKYIMRYLDLKGENENDE